MLNNIVHQMTIHVLLVVLGGYISKRNSKVTSTTTATSTIPLSSFTDTMYQLQKSRFTVNRPSLVTNDSKRRRTNTKKTTSVSSENRRRQNNS
jgi:hypothetical protein